MMFRVKDMLDTLWALVSLLWEGLVSFWVFGVLITVGTLAYAELQWLTDHWRPFASFPVVVDGALLALVTALLLRGLVDVRQTLQERQEYQQRLAATPSVMRALIATLPGDTFFLLLQRLALLGSVLVTFSGLCRHWAMTYGGFTAHSTDFFAWQWYGVEWLLDNYSLNLTQIFDWRFTDIHADALGPRLLVFGFNVVIDIVAVRGIVTLSQSMMRELAGIANENSIADRTRDDPSIRTP
jgi:hypothetical protein